MDITTDFGSVVLGSSPGGCTTDKTRLQAEFLCLSTIEPAAVWYTGGMQQNHQLGPIARFIISHSGGVVTAQNVNLFLLGVIALLLIITGVVLFGGSNDMPNYEPDPPSAPSEANISLR